MTEANAATEVVMPVDILRMLADHLFSVLMTLVEGESFDILVGSRAGSLAAFTQTLGSLDDWREDCSEKSFPLDVPSWSSCKEQWSDWRTR